VSCRAVFKDGSEFLCDAVMACTGYRNTLPLFDEFHPEISFAGLNPNPRVNYKQVFCVDHPGEIAFSGYARPAFGANPAAAELQAR
jgi:dimethylaniline monooxygenase (N-oxide forming)